MLTAQVELFWRSFVLRFAIRSDFKSAPLGQFSWFSFIFVSLLFGFEHDRWLVGIFAGMVYAGVLYRSKNLFDPILSHTITNFLLGFYVISTINGLSGNIGEFSLTGFTRLTRLFYLFGH